MAEKKAAILEEARQKGRDVEKKDLADRDLLTLLIRANMATDVPESQRLSDDEVLARELLSFSHTSYTRYSHNYPHQRFQRESTWYAVDRSC